MYVFGFASQEEGVPKLAVLGDVQHEQSNTSGQPVHLWLDQSADMISVSILLHCDCSSSYDTYSRQSHIAKGYFRPNEGLLQLSHSFSVEQISTE